MSSFYKQILRSILLFVFYSISAQSGMPGYYTIKNFTTKDYRMHPRNFYVSQDSRGLIYVGNAYGAMEYDGNTWRNVSIINGESVMSIVSAPDGKKYIGSNHEVGYLEVDSLGKNRYKSLGDKMPKDKSLIGNIYDIFSVEKELILWGCAKALSYRDGKFSWIKPANGSNEFSYAKKVRNTMYFHQKETGLLEYKKGILQSVENGDLLKGMTITELIAYDEKQFFVVSDQDIFFFDGQSLKKLPGSNGILRNHRLSHALLLTNGNILVATHDAGAFIFDKNGTLQKRLSSDNGLQSNNINFVFCDNRGGLWMALDNGVAYVEINSAFSFLERASGLSGMGITAALYGGRLYLGTSQGLYYSQWNDRVQEENFKPVKGISGQIWGLTIAEGMLICSQVNRLYTINGDQAAPVFTELPDEGNWKTTLLKKHPGYALVGTYSGLQLYQVKSGSIKYVRKLAGFDEACRTFMEDTDGSIWVSHGNRGLYKLTLSEDLKTVRYENYTEKNGFKPDFFNDINYLDGRLVFASDNGPYTYEAKQDRLIFNTDVEKILGVGYINKFYQFANQNLMAFKGGDIILFRKKDNTFEAEHFLLKKIHSTAVGSYEFAMPLNDNITIIGTEQGFTLFNTKFKPEQGNTYQVLLRTIIAPFQNDSMLFSGNFKSDQEVFEFPYSLNSIRLSYSTNFYESPDKMSYQYAWGKSGSELIWSGWNNHTDVDLTGVREGTYELHLRARNVYGSLSDEAVYTFRVLPPWYRSVWAYLVYTLLACAAAYVVYRMVKLRFRKQQLQLEQKYLIEMLQKDKELMELQNEALEERLVIQNNELSSMAAVLNQRSELLTQLKEKIRSFESDHPHFDPKLVREFIQSVDQHFDVSTTWSNFQNQFDEMHQNFLKRFREKHPKLDETWLLLCAYIRMNKSYKEISNLLNISVAAVDKRIYRLKEKLELETDGKIREYIQNF